MSKTENVSSIDVRTKKELNKAKTQSCISALESPVLQGLCWAFQCVDGNQTKQNKKEEEKASSKYCLVLHFPFCFLIRVSMACECREPQKTVFAADKHPT